MGSGFNLHMAIVSLKSQPRTGADKAVSSQPLAAHHALENKRPVAFLNLAESADGGERVPDQLAIDGDETGRAGQFHELVKTWAVAHAGSLTVRNQAGIPNSRLMRSFYFILSLCYQGEKHQGSLMQCPVCHRENSPQA